ncbi:MAG: sodium:proton antiporter NhaD [Rhizobiales bacterium]|nr:sodium:proton antiporter NhaD [Hyphomicrobiales bacterium]MBI3672815.1 sodium:proton antiporter NhaD [Hyphomicrobiales bacterium]
MNETPAVDFTQHWAGLVSLALFIAAYLLVIFEEATELRKSKPVLLAAGLIWVLIGIAYSLAGRTGDVQALAGQVIENYGELFLFLLVAITYVNVLEERRVFDVLRAKLVSGGLSYRQLFWLTGTLAFLLSGLLDNLTTALVMGAVVLAAGARSPRFATLGCISVVVAANAGGAYSPFGDITTLMVWQQGKLGFWNFFALFVPSLVNWLVPAAIMHFAIPKSRPEPSSERVSTKPGSAGVVVLFAATIATAVSFRNFLGLPPALGMMLGLGYLQAWSYLLQRLGRRRNDHDMVLDSFAQIQRVEWDTMLFFFGIILAVGGLGVLGYLALASDLLYAGLGPTSANVAVGVLSAIVDNIPLMFAVLTMNPPMSEGQWLLVTLTAGVGGSLLSIGSAAGVALMGQAREHYGFLSHLKWAWAIALGYGASIIAHMLINARLF